jgi:O-methyltransferase
MRAKRERGTARRLLLKNLAAPLRRAGRFERILGVTRLRGQDPTIQHQLIVPHATYSPWWTDEPFMRTFEDVRDATLVDIYRLYELWRLVDQVADLEGDLIEVGVWRGGSGCLIARRAQQHCPTATVYLCDTFEGVVKAGRHDNEYVGGEHNDTSSTNVRDLARRFSLDNVTVVEGVFPDEVDNQFGASRFRFAHIDVDVYDSARDSFLWIWDRLVPGGVVVFDDYGFHDCEGVTRFVNEAARRPDALFFHNVNGHGVIVKR